MYSTSIRSFPIGKILTITGCAVFTGMLITKNPFLSVAFLLMMLGTIGFLLKPQWSLLVLGCFLLIQTPMTRWTSPIVGRFDELFIVYLFVLMLISKLIKKEPFHKSPIDIPLLIFIGFGLFSNVMSQLTSTKVAVSGLLLAIKGFLIYYTFANVSFEERHIKQYIKTFYTIGVIIIVLGFFQILFPEAAHNLFGVSTQTRFGLRCMQSIFGHPGAFSALMALLVCFSLAFYFIEHKNKYLILGLFFTVCAILAFRRTSLAGVISAPILTAIFFYFKRSHVKLKKPMAYFFIIIFFVIIFSGALHKVIQDFHHRTFVVEDSPRALLTTTGIKIAQDYFPLGSGFGTFGSWMSQVEYSPLYYHYRLSSVWGLSPERPNYINDSFWPSIMAETGVFGLLACLWLLGGLFTICVKALKVLQKPVFRVFALAIFMLLIESLFESTKATFYQMSLWSYLYFGSAGLLWSLITHEKKERLKSD